MSQQFDDLMPVQLHSLTNILQAVPRLLEVLPPSAWAALLSCSRNLRHLIKRSTQKLTVHQSSRQFARLDGDWPELSLIIAAEQFLWIPRVGIVSKLTARSNSSQF